MKTRYFIAFACLFLIALMATVMAQVVNPSAPTNVYFVKNRTVSYPNGTILNHTRGYIYIYNINETQPTIKWVGYVGNVTGRYGLVDFNDNALYDWTITTTTGEIHATKEGPGTNTDGVDDGDQGGIPNWSNLSCAVKPQIELESIRWNHSTVQNATEDSYNNTFNAGTFVLDSFYAGTRQITDTTMYNGTSTNCYGINLYSDNAPTTSGAGSLWQEVVLTDATGEIETDANTFENDIIYATKIANSQTGYDGGNWDFQLLLPQSGKAGAQENVAFFFYIELI